MKINRRLLNKGDVLILDLETDNISWDESNEDLIFTYFEVDNTNINCAQEAYIKHKYIMY